jgi:L-lysine exporter family protein LysE/ArgO
VFAIFFQGLALSAAMILPIGPQNAFVMNQGIHRQFHLMIAGLCALSDMALICAGVFGGSHLLGQYPLLLSLVSWGGVAFLLWYGWGAFSHAWHGCTAMQQQYFATQNRWQVVFSMLAVTWLNPHVYLDTFVVLGSLGGRLQPIERLWFACGAVLSSTLWFFSLAILAALLSPWLRGALVQRVINLLVGSIMWVIAFQLAWQSVH